jgi:hypothetical protein
MILTSNQSFGSWGEVFGDRVIAMVAGTGSRELADRAPPFAPAPSCSGRTPSDSGARPARARRHGPSLSGKALISRPLPGGTGRAFGWCT